MKVFKPIRFFFCLLLIVSVSCHAQYFSATEVVDSIGKNKFYFVGQLHCNEANVIIERELLFTLNEKYGVQYYILEFGQSIAFLSNEYLKTGNDSLLSFINPKAGFGFIKAVRKYNSTTDKKIRFYGLDFENREKGRYTRKAFDIILKRIDSSDGRLQRLLETIVNSTSDIEKNLQDLRAYLSANENECRLLLKEDFTDVMLIANAQYNFSQSRDGAMLDNFIRLYKALADKNAAPSFFASFGSGHINTANNNGIANRLSNDKASPVAGQVSVIGVQYYNCGFKNTVRKSTDGSLNLACKNASRNFRPGINSNENQRIRFISKSLLKKLDCNKVDGFDGLLAIYNFNGSMFCDWE